jgi:O-antigen/teichoic acid export membrane protein
MSVVSSPRIKKRSGFRDFREIGLGNLVSRGGTFVFFALLTLVTRKLGFASYSFTFAVISVSQVLLSLDFGIGGLATTMSAGGANPTQMLRAMRPMLNRALRLQALLLLTVGVVEAAIFSRQTEQSAIVVFTLVIVQMLLTYAANSLVVYERLLFGAGRGREIANSSLWAVLSACAVLLASLGLPAPVRPFLSVTASIGLVAVSRLRARTLVRRADRSSDFDGHHPVVDISVARRHWILQLCALASFGSDQIVVSALSSRNESAAFAAHARYFQIGAAVMSVVIMTVWPMIGKAMRRGDVRQTRKIYFWSSVFAVSASAVFCAPMLFGWFPVAIFRSGQVRLSALAIPMSLWFVAMQWGQLLSQVQAALRDLKFQVRVGLVMASANLVTSIILCRRFGPQGAVWGSLLWYPLIVIVPVTYRLRTKDLWLAAIEPTGEDSLAPR